MDRMAIITKTQKRHEGKSERVGGGGGVLQHLPPSWERGLKPLASFQLGSKY